MAARICVTVDEYERIELQESFSCGKIRNEPAGTYIKNNIRTHNAYSKNFPYFHILSYHSYTVLTVRGELHDNVPLVWISCTFIIVLDT
jgi:hypothetical protein